MSASSQLRFELKHLLQLMLPILITQFAQAGFGLIDTIMAGQLSAEDLASIAVAVGLWMPVMLLCTGIMFATSPLVAAAMGAKKHKDIAHISHQALWIALLLGLLGMLALQLMPLFFEPLKIPENLHHKAGTFLHAIAFGMPAVTMYTVLRCYTEALGRAKVVTAISLLALPLLIPFNYVFMHGLFGLPEMGSAGCGVANAILQWLMLFALAAYVYRGKAFTETRLFQKFEKIDPILFRRILGLGVPIGLAFFFEISIFSTAALVISPLGDIVIAAHQIAMSITSQLFMIPLSLALALTIRVGQHFGAGNFDAMRKVQKLGFMVATVVACCTMIFLWFGRGWLIQLYNDDPAVLHVAYGLVIYALAYQLVDAWQVIAGGCLRGMQDTKSPMWISFISYWIIALPIGIYLTRYANASAKGVWIGLIIGLSIACVLLLIRLIANNRHFKHQAQQQTRITQST